MSLNVQKLQLWHQRLGHVNQQRLKAAVRDSLIEGIEKCDGDLPFCQGCVEGKQKRKPFHGLSGVQRKKKLQLVHSDICGPMSISSLGGSKYFISFTDDYTRYCRIYFIK